VTFALTFWKIKLPAFLENIPLYQHDIRGTTNLLGHTAISVGALKRASLRIQQENGHFEHLLQTH
jgi:hypothetical protein